MDFGTLLHTAQRNEKAGKNKEVKYYSTKFEPPKKEQKKKELSANIKRFLAKKEQEEKQKQNEVSRERQKLLALRAQDKKATKRVSFMLKRTKSANQSVLQEARDLNDTSITLAGPAQPDEDDYGYVSQEASAFYNKMMEKYNKMPDEPKFSLDKKKKPSANLNAIKERVKAAIDKEKEEAAAPHRRKRKHDEILPEPEQKRDEPPAKAKPKPAPPTINFNDLLKIAEKKQFEPIIIEQKPKEEERLFTKKQKKEMEREKEWRDRREGRLPPLEKKPQKPEGGPSSKKPVLNENKSPETNAKKQLPSGSTNSNYSNYNNSNNNVISDKKSVVNSSFKDKNNSNSILYNRLQNKEKVPLKQAPNQSQSQSQKPVIAKSSSNSLSNRESMEEMRRRKEMKLSSGKLKEAASGRDREPQRKVQSDLKPKQFPSKDLKPKEFPPPDVRRRDFPPADVKRKPVVNKRRILDDDEDYDSEMDDFIDDGPEENQDYSKYISEIFGYDKSKYRYVDDDVDNMESSFAQQMKEEAISKKIGIMEDLEDMRMEEEEKRMKAQMKKKRP